MRHGTDLNPAGRFERIALHADDSADACDDRVTYFDDRSRSIVSRNDAADLPFNYSVNPYRGCVHGCTYCYARPTHEFLGLSAGRDFETRLFVKRDAPRLLREFLSKPSWRPEPICFSGVTDAYQPAERRFRLTRACLEVCRDFGQPVMIVTKNARIVEDVELLSDMAARDLVRVAVSVTTLDRELAMALEPRTSVPAARITTIRRLSESGVPVRALMAPVIPGLNDHESDAILTAARDAGAVQASYGMIRLPGNVAPIFEAWLREHRPDAADAIMGRIRDLHHGRLNDPPGRRMIGDGAWATTFRAMFNALHRRHGYTTLAPPTADHFAVPSKQPTLF